MAEELDQQNHAVIQEVAQFTLSNFLSISLEISVAGGESQ